MFLDRIREKMQQAGAGGGGGGAPNWRDGIPEDIRASEALKDFKDVGALAKSYVETKALVGRSLRLPGPDASEADKKAFREELKKKVPTLIELPEDEKQFEEVASQLWKRLGKPDDEKGYPAIKDLPEGVEVNEDEIRQLAKGLGLTRKQYAQLVSGVVEDRKKRVELESESRKALKKELGEAFDERLSAAAAAAKQLGYSDERVAQIQKGLVSVEDAKAWINVAKALGKESRDLGGGPESRGPGKLTPAEAREQIAEIYRNPDFTNPQSPRYRDLVEKNLKLHQIAFAEEE